MVKSKEGMSNTAASEAADQVEELHDQCVIQNADIESKNWFLQLSVAAEVAGARHVPAYAQQMLHNYLRNTTITRSVRGQKENGGTSQESDEYMACVSNGNRHISGSFNHSHPHPGIHPRFDEDIQEAEEGEVPGLGSEADGGGDSDGLGLVDLPGLEIQNDGQMIENQIKYTLELAAALGEVIWNIEH